VKAIFQEKYYKYIHRKVNKYVNFVKNSLRFFKGKQDTKYDAEQTINKCLGRKHTKKNFILILNIFKF
jgi:hypothetical protein